MLRFGAGAIVAMISAAAILARLFPASAAAAEASPYAGYDKSVFLPYVNAPGGNDDIAGSPKLRISFGGASHLAVMDTGSTGIVVSAGDIPGVDRLPSTPGQLTYSSSGRVMVGKWVTTPVTVEGADGSRFLTRPIPVLAVTRIECQAKARACKPETRPKGVTMLGIGFGREGDSQAQSTPETNPFLQASVAGTDYRRGYIVTRTGVRIGLTADAVGPDFAFVKLTADADHPGDWSGAPFCVTLNGKTPPACGAALVDTGVVGMYITLPPDLVGTSTATNAKGEPTLADGATLDFAFPGEEPTVAVPGAHYSFTIGKAGNPLAPGFLVLNTRRPKPFVNTSVRFLNGFDYLYDADAGMVGYRWTGHADPGFGSADPGPPAKAGN